MSDEAKIGDEEMVRVYLMADEKWPVLRISVDAQDADTTVPARLVEAVEFAGAALEAAEQSLLRWLHPRQPTHFIFDCISLDPVPSGPVLEKGDGKS